MWTNEEDSEDDDQGGGGYLTMPTWSLIGHFTVARNSKRQILRMDKERKTNRRKDAMELGRGQKWTFGDGIATSGWNARESVRLRRSTWNVMECVESKCPRSKRSKRWSVFVLRTGIKIRSDRDRVEMKKAKRTETQPNANWHDCKESERLLYRNDCFVQISRISKIGKSELTARKCNLTLTGWHSLWFVETWKGQRTTSEQAKSGKRRLSRIGQIECWWTVGATRIFLKSRRNNSDDDWAIKWCFGKKTKKN